MGYVVMAVVVAQRVRDCHDKHMSLVGPSLDLAHRCLHGEARVEAESQIDKFRDLLEASLQEPTTVSIGESAGETGEDVERSRPHLIVYLWLIIGVTGFNVVGGSQLRDTISSLIVNVEGSKGLWREVMPSAESLSQLITSQGPADFGLGAASGFPLLATPARSAHLACLSPSRLGIFIFVECYHL